MANPDDAELYRLAERLGSLLLAHGHCMAAAESCTGGWLAKCLTDVPGSSAWFEGGFVTYGNQAKQAMLGVAGETLAAHGAVSMATVREMAAGTLRVSGAQTAVAISGIAGPGGGTPDKPVGTVWFAWQRRGAEAATRRERFSGDRETVRRQAVAMAISGLEDLYRNSRYA